MISDLIKNSPTFQTILKDIKAGNQKHSYLFCGVDEYTNKLLMNLVCQALLCSDLCGTCENCVKLSSGHPDVFKFPKKNQLLVEDSKKIVEESFVKPIFAPVKIFLIENIDKSTLEAQNKLLKVLEEPNSNMYYLITCKNFEAVLPTIRSRCFKVDSLNLDKNAIKSELNASELALVLGAGALGKTLEMTNKKNLDEVFDLAQSVAFKLNSSKNVPEFSKLIFDSKDDFLLILEIILLILEDIVSYKNSREIKLKMLKEKYKEQKDYSLKCIVKLDSLIRDVVKKLNYNTNLSLVIDNFLMRFLEVKYLCR